MFKSYTMNNCYQPLILLILLSALAAGCQKMVEVNSSGNQLSAQQVFEEDESATRVLTTVYASLFTEGASPYITAVLTGLQGDELTNPGIQHARDYYANAIDPVSNLYCSVYWDRAYHYIYRLNDLLRGCAAASGLSPAVKKQLMAEALFTRAYLYFYLVNLYGDIPLALTTDYLENKSLPAQPAAKIYEQILKDLSTAQQDLHTDYIGKDNQPGTTERVRPNKAAADALLARVYLYMDKWAAAEQAASLLINNAATYRLVAPEQTFLKGSAETIWALRPSFPNYTGVNTVDGSQFILDNSPISDGKPYLRQELVDHFEEGDLRKAHWIGKYVDTTHGHADVYHYPYKYKVKADAELKECTVVLRLAEQYLIRAEARARQGKYTAALEDVNEIRKRAGVKPYTSQDITLNEAGLLPVIMQERQKEFFAEAGHRWLDLKRTDSCDAVMERVAKIKKTTWGPAMQYWPIPAEEIVRNPSLHPSAGYRY